MRRRDRYQLPMMPLREKRLAFVNGNASVAGVTLVELMTAIVIIVVLAALVLLAIQQMTIKGQGVHCMNNMRNISTAILTYVSDHNGAFPPFTLETEGVTEMAGEQRWPALFANELGRDAFYCRTLRSPYRTSGNANYQFIDYGYNYLFLGSVIGPAEPQQVKTEAAWVDHGRQTARLSNLESPSKTVLLAESLLVIGSNAGRVGFYVVLHSNSGVRPDPRHGKGVIICWADGHISKEIPDADYNLPAEMFKL